MQRTGKFELCDDGTIFLDEIGDMALATQTKILRVLQQGEIQRVGGTGTLKVNVRILAATNKDLEGMVKAKTFREDLYYRLNVVRIKMPPLRERSTDIPQIVDFCLQNLVKEKKSRVTKVSPEVLALFTKHDWPGNVRELENCIERGVLMSQDDVLHGHHLPPTLQTAESSNTVVRGTLQETVERVEKEMIIETLKNVRGNKSKAAKALGITERIMGLRVEKYNINPKSYRNASL